VIAAHCVSKKYGDFEALRNVSVDVPRGSLTALLGPSGSGKSTLLRVIAGLEEPETGRVLIDDRDVTRTPPQRRGIGFVFQHYAAFRHMTVAQNVAFGLRVRRRPKSETQAKVRELLGLVHLTGWAGSYPDSLSGGQRQRMALARALAVEPSVLLLDEPFGALDARVREELRSWLRRLHDELHVTTVFVTHDQREAMEVSDQVVVLNEGRVEQSGPPVEVYDSPVNEFVMGFVGPVTHLAGQVLRPHDFDILREPDDGAVEAQVERILPLGFEVRVELVLGDASPLTVLLTRLEAELLELEPGEIVYARPRPGSAPGPGAGLLGEASDLLR
jgi:sulfate/thiosulfate transport system ATP-binding protein